MIKKRPTTEQRFWSKVNKNKKGCWEWQGYKQRYGKLGINHKVILAHRYSWELHKGKIPKGLCVLHKCDNPPCVNPKHLFLGTLKDNMQDMIKKGRANHPGMKGEQHPNAKITTEVVMIIRKLYKRPDLTYEKLAGEFNLSFSHIGRIIKKKQWKHN